MSEQEKKVNIPDGMLNAAWKAVGQKIMERDALGKSGSIAELHVARIAVGAALLWLSENPIEPTDKQIDKIMRTCPTTHSASQWLAVEWQRIMFLAPQPDDSEIEDLLEATYSEDSTGIRHVGISVTSFEDKIRTAYQRGLNKRNSK